MPPITGRYEADFSQYKSETQSATQQLRLFEAGAVTAAAAVGRVTTTAPKSFEQFSATTVNTRKEMDAMSAAAGRTSGTFTTLSRGLGDADKTLALMGVHIGPEIKALEELGASAGKGVGSIGLLGTAGLALGAGMAGWNVGRAAAEFFGLDEKISKATASLLHYGDVAAEVAGAKQDAIDKAIRDGADANIEYADAIQYNIKHSNDFADSLNTSQHRLSTWQGELRRLRTEGTLKALEADISSGNSTVAEMAKQYGISERAIQYFTRTLQEHARAQDLATEASRKATEAAKRQADEAKAAQDKLDAIVAAQKERVQDTHAALYGQKDIDAAKLYADAIGDVSGAQLLASVNAEGAKQAADALWTAEQRMIALAAETGAALNPLVEQYERLRLALTANARAEADDAAATAANTAEKQRLNSEMERAFVASGGTDLEGFRSGLVSAGQSALKPSVGLRPSAFAEFGINARTVGVDAPLPPLGAVTVNMSGMLLSNNPAARQEFGQFVSGVVGDSVKQSRKVSPF